MASHVVVLSAGLLLCLIGFVVVFEIKEVKTSSVITGLNQRRLIALWILSSLIFLFLFVWFLAKYGFAWGLTLLPISGGLLLSVAGFVVTRRLAGTAIDDASAALSRSARRSLLLLFLTVSGCLLDLLFRIPCQQTDVSRGDLVHTFFVFIVSVSLVGLIYLFVAKKPDSLADDGDPMPVITRRVLAFYLLLLGVGLLVALWRIGSLEFPNSGVKIETTAPGPAATPASATSAPLVTESNVKTEKHPVLYQLFPQTPVAAAPIVYITAYGDNFTPESRIRFNQQVQATIFVDASRIQAQLDEATIDSMDPISVDVITKDQATSKDYITGVIVMTITKAHAKDEVLGLHLDLTRELQLLLLAMLAGALGSFVHALKSFGDFIGNRTLTASWFWWYMTRPFLGAALAVIFYAVLRGGFMAGTQADAKTVNQFGVIAMGALVGMFADKASDKLAEIFDTLFKGADDRSGKLAAPILDRFDPPTIARGSAAMNLTMIGDRLGTVTQVKFDNAVHPHGTVTQKEIVVPLTAQELANPRSIKVSVVGDNGESPTKDLQIT